VIATINIVAAHGPPFFVERLGYFISGGEIVKKSVTGLGHAHQFASLLNIGLF